MSERRQGGDTMLMAVDKRVGFAITFLVDVLGSRSLFYSACKQHTRAIALTCSFLAVYLLSTVHAIPHSTFAVIFIQSVRISYFYAFNFSDGSVLMHQVSTGTGLEGLEGSCQKSIFFSLNFISESQPVFVAFIGKNMGFILGYSNR
ncbi:hypothetical protein KQX54_014389 [Cotesia glomerata]|uniref:CASP-like protein n=1 Tax=Cotesia glomerata TaxID=32391 RepID=A0AAV7I8I2_COTGL|nr:hypothetical protein KQX54_014389 [Cotesia glomerata]